MSKNEKTRNKLLSATRLHFEAKRLEAIATLDIYFNKAVGIGEHSDLLPEMIKWTDVLAAANDAIENLDRVFNMDGSPRDEQG
jgi:hypothetical protein